MSKIEEALKKALKEKNHLNKSNDVEVNLPQEVPQQRFAKLSKNSIVDYASSAKEIALMNEGQIIDDKSLSELRIIYSDMNDNQIANTYRGLRTKLIQKSNGNNFVVMITSCSPEVDNENVCLNLATAFSFDESKTSLIVDCNLNEPKIDSLLSINTELGLTDYLENEDLDIESIIYNSGVKRLRIIPAGTSRETSAEYFTSLKMRLLMKELLKRYSDRFIFIDAAPIIDSADTRILIELCDFVILEVPYGTTTPSKIKAAVEAIGNERFLGVVFSGVPRGPKKIFSDLFK